MNLNKKISTDNHLLDVVLFAKIFSVQFDQFKKIRELFSGLEEYMVLYCIVSRNLKELLHELKTGQPHKDIDLVIEEFWDKLKNEENSGVSIHGISRDTEIPRTTVTRMSNSLIRKKLITKNADGYLVPTSLVRSYCKDLRNITTSTYNEYAEFYAKLELD